MKEPPMKVFHIPSRSSSCSSSSGSVFLVHENQKIFLIKMKSKSKPGKKEKALQAVKKGANAFSNITRERIQENFKTKKKVNALRKEMKEKGKLQQVISTCS